MEQTGRGALAIPVGAVVLAAAAAVCFGVGELIEFSSDSGFAVTWVLGWVLLAWAALVGGAYAAVLGARAVRRRPVPLEAAALAVAALAIVAVIAASHPLWGSGSGVG